MWEDLGKRKVQVFDSEEEIKRKKEEERRRKEASKKSSFFPTLRSMLSGSNLGEVATKARKDVTEEGFWKK